VASEPSMGTGRRGAEVASGLRSCDMTWLSTGFGSLGKTCPQTSQFHDLLAFGMS
jgi:hypothetical protein